MIEYVNYINKLKTSNNESMMMVYDSFRGHLEETVKKKFCESGIDLAIIPGGLTSICQPLDFAINKPFKNNLRKEWHLWMANGGAGETAARNLRCARLSDVCGWVKRSWEQISNEMIIQSFKTCKISNSLDEDIDDFDEIIQNSDKENEEGLEIEMCDLQAR